MGVVALVACVLVVVLDRAGVRVDALVACALAVALLAGVVVGIPLLALLSSAGWRPVCCVCVV